jgi:hypothetical protein
MTPTICKVSSYRHTSFSRPLILHLYCLILSMGHFIYMNNRPSSKENIIKIRCTLNYQSCVMMDLKSYLKEKSLKNLGGKNPNIDFVL